MVWGNEPDGGLTGRGVCTHVHTLVLPLALGMVPQVARDSEAAAILLCRFRRSPAPPLSQPPSGAEGEASMSASPSRSPTVPSPQPELGDRLYIGHCARELTQWGLPRFWVAVFMADLVDTTTKAF